MNTSYSELLTASRLMASGLRTAGKPLAKRGLDEAFVLHLEEVSRKAETLDNEQEVLKSKLAAQTAAVNANKEELLGLLAEAKKLIKLDLPKTDWKQFGITDAK